MSLLRIHEVDAFYDSAQILEAVSLQIDRGEKVAVLGRNGVGKTTLINTLLGVARVGAGSIEMQGKTFHKIKAFDAVRHGIAVVPQGRRIIPTLTVTENLMMGAASGRTGNWNLESVLDLFPILRERAIVMGTSLSGGQQQMLAIGRALMANPELLILDEPSEGLAPVIVDQLIDLLNQLADQGTSIMLVEQNISFVLDVVQRYCVLSKGRVVEQGSSVGLTVENLKKYISV
jgi:ABC-type branched-subunit amino acid transport system ATPase component